MYKKINETFYKNAIIKEIKSNWKIENNYELNHIKIILESIIKKLIFS